MEYNNIKSVFKDIQDQGFRSGYPSIIIELSDLERTKRKTHSEILEEILNLKTNLTDDIVITGDEPFLNVDFINYISKQLPNNYLTIETTGSVVGNVERKDRVLLSVRPDLESVGEGLKELDNLAFSVALLLRENAPCAYQLKFEFKVSCGFAEEIEKFLNLLRSRGVYRPEDKVFLVLSKQTSLEKSGITIEAAKVCLSKGWKLSW